MIFPSLRFLLFSLKLLAFQFLMFHIFALCLNFRQNYLLVFYFFSLKLQFLLELNLFFLEVF